MERRYSSSDKGLIGSPRLPQEMKMFSASVARITSVRHVPEQTEPLEKIRV